MLNNYYIYFFKVFISYFLYSTVLFCSANIQENNTYNLLRREIIDSSKNKSSDEATKLDVFFNNIINAYENDIPDVASDEIYEKTKFFYGGPISPKKTILNNINRCVSTLGRYFLAYLLSSPFSDLNEIEINQNVIKFLLKEEIVSENIKEIFNEFKDIEDDIIEFYDTNSKMYEIKDNYNLLKKFYFINRNNSSKNVKSIYFKKIFSDIWNILINPYFSGLSIALYLVSYFIIFDRITDNILLKLFQFFPIPFVKEIVMIIYGYKIIGALNSSKSIIGGILFAAGVFTNVKSYFNIYKKFKSYKNDYEKIAYRVKKFRKLLLLMKKINAVFENYTELNIYKSKRLQNVFNLINNCSIPEVKWAVERLLKGDISMNYFSYSAPSILAIYRILNDNRKVFINALCELIRIDPFISMVEYKKECGENLSFTKFIKGSQKPIINFKNLWNPMLDLNVAVKNDIDIGNDYSNMLLCGHNGGGKSTYLNAILVNFILIQTFGLSFSTYSETTVFNKILSFSRISDDINTGDSLYKAEIKQLNEFLQLCNRTKYLEYFILSVFEEPLSGTDSRSAISILSGIFKYLNKNNKNLINIISSHYNRLSKLDQIQGFKNFYTDVVFNHDGSLKYLYKIKEGVPKLSLAIPIASKIGVVDDIINAIKDEYEAYVE